MAAGHDTDKLIAELDKALQFPGVANSWTMPIKARIDMLSTGIRTPIGIKVFGKDLVEMERLAREIEPWSRQVPGTSSAYAERITGGFYLDIEPDRARAGALRPVGRRTAGHHRHGAGRRDGDHHGRGRERFGVIVRYPRELRSDPEAGSRARCWCRCWLRHGAGRRPWCRWARWRRSIVKGAPAIRTENALLSAYIYVDIRERDIGSYVAAARRR
jgi:Cu(I)/Ag(I) efflux system membrane protein CusA/SilA